MPPSEPRVKMNVRMDSWPDWAVEDMRRRAMLRLANTGARAASIAGVLEWGDRQFSELDWGPDLSQFYTLASIADKRGLRFRAFGPGPDCSRPAAHVGGSDEDNDVLTESGYHVLIEAEPESGASDPRLTLARRFRHPGCPRKSCVRACYDGDEDARRSINTVPSGCALLDYELCDVIVTEYDNPWEAAADLEVRFGRSLTVGGDPIGREWHGTCAYTQDAALVLALTLRGGMFDRLGTMYDVDDDEAAAITAELDGKPAFIGGLATMLDYILLGDLDALTGSSNGWTQERLAELMGARALELQGKM